MNGLTAKQSAFVDEYVIDFNATRAAKAAGYSEDSARAIGCQNLTKLNIRKEIDKLLSGRVMTRDEALSRLSEQARADLGEYMDENGIFDFAAMKRDGKTHLLKDVNVTRVAGKGVKWDLRTYDAQNALRLILDNITPQLGSEDNPLQVVTYIKENRDAPND
jgi:phage terminase small subunit